MARRTFFSFHYERDAWRAGQVRNCNMLPTSDQSGFIDCVDWESIKRQGDAAIKRWILAQMEGSSVSAILIGAETALRPVRYEILESWNRGNGLVGIRIHNIKDQNRATDVAGANPLESFNLSNGEGISSVCRVYDWVMNDGRNNLGAWIEEAYRIRSRYSKGETISEISTTAPGGRASYASGARIAFAPRAPWCS